MYNDYMLCQRCKKNESRTPNAQHCNSCVSALWREKNGISMYGGNRQKALIRDNFTCQLCGKNKNETRLQIHHIDGNGTRKNGKILKSSEQNNALENLMTVCCKCHAYIEQRKGAPKGSSKVDGFSRKYKCCILCGSTKRHASRGVCFTCYEKTRKEYKAQWFHKRKLLTL